MKNIKKTANREACKEYELSKKDVKILKSILASIGIARIKKDDKLRQAGLEELKRVFKINTFEEGFELYKQYRHLIIES